MSAAPGGTGPQPPQQIQMDQNTLWQIQELKQAKDNAFCGIGVLGTLGCGGGGGIATACALSCTTWKGTMMTGCWPAKLLGAAIVGEVGGLAVGAAVCCPLAACVMKSYQRQIDGLTPTIAPTNTAGTGSLESVPLMQGMG